MLLIEAHLSATSAVPLLRVTVGRLTDEPVADYAVHEYGQSEALVAEARLRSYPRWSEPETGLAARALDALWPHDGLAPATSVYSLVIAVGFGSVNNGMRRILKRVEAPAPVPAIGTNLRERVFRALCNDAWGTRQHGLCRPCNDAWGADAGRLSWALGQLEPEASLS